MTGEDIAGGSASNLSKDWTSGTLERDDLPEELRLALRKPGGLPASSQDPPSGVPHYRVKLKRDPKTEPPVATMFRERMAREGRTKELKANVQQVMREHGMGFSAALRVVMPTMGYINDQAEIRMYRANKEQILIDRVESAIASDVIKEEMSLEAEQARKEEEEFELALSKLPANAQRAREIEWIEAHPAMMRQSRMKVAGKTGPVSITAADILDAPHGVCPSRGAAVMLQHWANNAAKFFEQIMSEAKKKSSDGAGSTGGDIEVEDDLSEVEDLLDF